MNYIDRVIDKNSFLAAHLLYLSGYVFSLIKPKLYSNKAIYLFSSLSSSRLLRTADAGLRAGDDRLDDAEVRGGKERPAFAGTALAVDRADPRYLFYDPLSGHATQMRKLAEQYSLSVEIRKEMLMRGDI